MYRIGKAQARDRGYGKVATSPGEMPVTSQGDFLSLQDIIRRPKRVLHSKNPFKLKQQKVSLHLPEKQEPLSGNVILRICKCEFAEEVLRLDISGSVVLSRQGLPEHLQERHQKLY